MKNRFLAYAAIAICGGTGSSLKSRRRHPPAIQQKHFAAGR
jgi:hypothetical protein